MSFWRKMQIKIRNRWNDPEYRSALKGTIIVILILFLWLLYNIIKRTIETNSYDKIIPWLKMLGFSTSVVFFYIFLICILPGILLYKLNKKMYHEKSFIAWIPILRIYLLGNLTVKRNGGKILILGLIVFILFQLPIIIYIIILVILYIYALIKYIKLR